MNFLRPPGFCILSLSESPGFRKFNSKTLLIFRLVRLSEAPRYSHGWILRGPPVFVWMESLRPSSIRMVGFLEYPRFPYGGTFCGLAVFVWLNFQSPSVFGWFDSMIPPGFREIVLFKVPGFRIMAS